MNFTRILKWAKDPNRKSAVLSFSEGENREVAYLIELVDAAHRERILELVSEITGLKEQIARRASSHE